MRPSGLALTLFSFLVLATSLCADPASDAHPRISIESNHLTLTFEQKPGPDLYIVELSDELAQWHSGDAFMETVSTVPGPGGTQTVKVRSRSLVSVKPKEFLRLRVFVDPHGPVVYLSGLRYAWNTASAQLAARVLGVQAAHLTSLSLNGNALPVQAGDFLLNVTLNEGVNTFTLAATDDHGVPGQATAKMLRDTIPPVIAITAPASGSTFTISRVNVSGTVSDANVLTSVKVNGVPAVVGAGQFTAYNVPLTVGANYFVAVATDIAGNVGTSERGVNADGSANGGLLIDPVHLAAAPVSGFAPLTVTFTPQSQIPGTLQTLTYDFDGDMLPDVTANALTPVTHTYSVAGEFFPTVTIATSVASASNSGGIFADPATRLTIRVENPPVVQSTFNIPTPIDLHAAPDGTLYVLSQSTATVKQYDAAGNILRTATGLGTNPSGLTVDEFGDVFVAETGNHQVVMLWPNGNTFDVVMTLGRADATAGTGDGEFNAPYDVAVSAAGEIYVTDTGNHRIQKFGPDGSFLGVIDGSGIDSFTLNMLKGISLGLGGELLATDSASAHIVALSHGRIAGAIGAEGSSLGSFHLPSNVVSTFESLYVADTGNNRVQKLAKSTDGEASTAPGGMAFAIGSGLGLLSPNSVAIRSSAAADQLYIADTGNNRILVLSLVQPATPEAVWNSFKLLLQSHELEAALTHMLHDVRDAHREFFNAIGSNAAAEVVGEVGQISPLLHDGDSATYKFTHLVTGVPVTFFIQFIKEDGKWKIAEF